MKKKSRFCSQIIEELDAITGDFDKANAYLEAAIVLAKCGVDPDDAEEMCKVWVRHQFSWGKGE